MFGGVIYVLYICIVKEIQYGTSYHHRSCGHPNLRRTHSVQYERQRYGVGPAGGDLTHCQFVLPALGWGPTPYMTPPPGVSPPYTPLKPVFTPTIP